MNRTPIGILGVGTFLPEERRMNDWWAPSVVETWPKKMAAVLSRTMEDPEFPITEGVQKSIDGLKACSNDPFLGVRERRVMPDGMMPSDMEIRAGKEAIALSGIDPKDIDILLVHSMVPNYHTYNTAAPVHHGLHLKDSAFVLGVDSVCNSFLSQLTLASDMLASGRGKYALLVQSSAVSRIADYSDWYSAFLGDGATAVVLGPVSEGRGLLSMRYRVQSQNHLGIITGIPKGQWYDAGRNVAFLPDKEAARRTLFQTPDNGRLVLLEALSDAGIDAQEVDFYACHQAAGNLRRQTQELVGMTKAQFIDTLPWAGTLSSANIPLQLACAVRERTLQEGAAVAMFSMGAGTTVAAGLLRWGR